ncbi:starch synthase 3, chloroplastic/amyloplastic [Ziziphus jujuba]|uniref:starch synthase n=1 Tax=Ziziphus jujuba TaxID=326968 RepID=A0ABM3I992_ZIZJJ|nr:starch synthase 3, chloroplastic/amyloplastic [Ziziphus jujuba]
MIGLVAPVAWLFKHHYMQYFMVFVKYIVNIRNVVEGKRAAKQALQQKLGPRTADLPLVSIITCLTHQKRMHPIKHGIWHNLCSNIQVVLPRSASDLVSKMIL